MLPLHADGRPIGDVCYIRTGLLGFLGPVNDPLLLL